MVGGTPKPFACTSEGCTMTFTNEDHLNVHQRKHEMVLNLGIKNINLVADQTPTPTRFLRNCEEVGLFQDLQNVNPFDETFRKATELVKTGSTLPIPILSEDDTLHTPHIFPHLPDENISLYSSKKTEKVTQETVSINNDKILSVTEKTETVLTLTNHHDSDDHIYAISPLHSHKNTPTILISDSIETNCNINNLETKIKSNTPTKSINDKPINKAKYRRYTSNNVKIKPNVNNVVNAKTKLHELLMQNKKQIQPATATPVIVLQNMPVPVVKNVVPILQTGPVLNKLPILPKTDNMSIVKNNTIVTNKKITNVVKTKQRINTDSDKKEDLLARNRAAAVRCRERKKIFIESLEKQLDNVNKENKALQKENAYLKNEILHLKTLLLAHKDCSVTTAMNMGQNIPINIAEVVNISTEKITKEIKINKDLETSVTVSIPEIKTISINETEKPGIIMWKD